MPFTRHLVAHHLVTIAVPLWPFLNQPLFTPTPVTLNPFRFWKCYTKQHLERCWTYDSILLLERCWVKELEMEKHSPY